MFGSLPEAPTLIGSHLLPQWFMMLLDRGQRWHLCNRYGKATHEGERGIYWTLKDTLTNTHKQRKFWWNAGSNLDAHMDVFHYDLLKSRFVVGFTIRHLLHSGSKGHFVSLFISNIPELFVMSQLISPGDLLASWCQSPETKVHSYPSSLLVYPGIFCAHWWSTKVWALCVCSCVCA